MIDLVVQGTIASIEAATRPVEDLCRQLHYTQERGWEVATAVHEALLNARDHGHFGDVSRPIRFRVLRQGDGLVAEIRDEGRGLGCVPPLPDIAQKLLGKETPRGWGLFLMRSLASELMSCSFTGGGHLLRMRFGPRAPAAPVELRVREVGDVA
jgi:serine/threonine-protein kinase RsbW